MPADQNISAATTHNQVRQSAITSSRRQPATSRSQSVTTQAKLCARLLERKMLASIAFNGICAANPSVHRQALLVSAEAAVAAAASAVSIWEHRLKPALI